VTEDLAKALGLDHAKGALIAQVLSNTPAAHAGMKAGDVIVSVDDKPLDRSRDLPRIVAAMKKGQVVHFGIWRDGKTMTIDATIDQMPTDMASRSEHSATSGKLAYGVALAPLTRAERQAHNIPDDVNGVLILRVQSGSPAADKGLQAGDVIIRVGNRAVTSPDEAIAALNKAKLAKTPAILLISRNGSRIFVAVEARGA
jgi:serine protease Do